MEEREIELTILMPCLNEAETLEICIKKAMSFLKDNNVDGEVLIADNGSTDGSQEIAIRNGARVVNIEQKGYGSALRGGSENARGRYVIMGDADDSYNFLNLMPFLTKLREGYELVMGNRFKGGIEKGAMPPLHKYLGNPVLSFIGRIFYPSDIKDFHCGLRGYNRAAIQSLQLQTTGMEYASEMVVQATLHKLKMIEVPTTLSPDGRSRPPHLRSWRDGWRHLKFLMMYSPNWTFLYPGIILSVIGLVIMVSIGVGPTKIGNVNFGINTMMYGSAALLVGISISLFSMFTKSYALSSGFIPNSPKTIGILEKFTVEKGVVIGVLLTLLGIVATIVAFVIWGNNSFGNLQPESIMKITIPATTLIAIGVELIFASFFLGILEIERKK
ncbi:glycosyltransferase family 2 protein [Acetobacterium wieringae]|uniref:glycosyltransferase family 2 protein n=1 Tax=Acetobacterium wieringae TaxID=52694 RepID=UPI0026F2C827|nr:glycosyltransferase family 2 protein [Acetobacterium wieringae]